jgi:hypothetical protein
VPVPHEDEDFVENARKKFSYTYKGVLGQDFWQHP